MRLTNLRILIISCLISAFSFAQVITTRPIFGKCLDNDLGAILKIIIVAQERSIPINPTSATETNLKVDSLMRMIKKYLVEERSISKGSTRRSRRFFFWPYRPWVSIGSKGIHGGVHGSIYGGFGPDGFTVGGGLNRGIRSHWRRNQ